MRRDIQARLPKGDLPDILLEVCARTNLADSFTHVNERGARVADFPISLAAVLVAESCNIGFEPLIRSDIPALRRDRLSWVSQNFIRDQTLRAANARLVVSHDALPIVRLWGSGDVASADGVRFVVRGEPIHAGYNPKYFGRRRGVTWYNLVSDQSTGLGGISVTLESPLTLQAHVSLDKTRDPAVVVDRRRARGPQRTSSRGSPASTRRTAGSSARIASRGAT